MKKEKAVTTVSLVIPHVEDAGPLAVTPEVTWHNSQNDKAARPLT